MCGIAGAWSKNHKFSSGTLNKSLDHRGPDSQGFFQAGNIHLFHTRLSILDTSEAGSQPFHFKNLSMVYNGEIYNFLDIRNKLIGFGYSFETSSDSEVLIVAFYHWRLEAVHHFIGMFAFAVFDNDTEELFLYRDRVGVKPLYFADTPEGFFFGSEMKALYEFPFNKSVKLSSVSDYFRFGYISENKTMFNEVNKVPPGCFLHFQDEHIKIIRYWNLGDEILHDPGQKTEIQWLEELEATMISAFKYRMVSDVPVGVFLSGGIDSSLVAAILQKHYGTINTFTIGFHEKKFNEAVHAKRIATILKTTHKEQILGMDDGKGIMHQFYDIFDEPFADSSGIPTSLVASLAKKSGIKVVLSADGGDELFGGYGRYHDFSLLYRKVNKIPSGIRNLVAHTLGYIIPEFIRNHVYAENIEHKLYKVEELLRHRSVKEFYEGMLANQAHGEIKNIMGSSFVKEHSNEWQYQNLKPAEQMMLWDFSSYLPDDLLVKVDRATMFHSIEGREPFLDHRLVTLAYQMPLNMKIRNGQHKYALRKILSNYIPLHEFERPKQGFNIPLFEWFEKDFDALFESFLSKEMIDAVGFLSYSEIEKEKKKYYYYRAKGKAFNIEKMWRVLSFMMWWNKWLKNA